MSKTPDYFVGNTIMISGTASGIGRSTAYVFARDGENILCIDINYHGILKLLIKSIKKVGLLLQLTTLLHKEIRYRLQ